MRIIDAKSGLIVTNYAQAGVISRYITRDAGKAEAMRARLASEWNVDVIPGPDGTYGVRVRVAPAQSSKEGFVEVVSAFVVAWKHARASITI